METQMNLVKQLAKNNIKVKKLTLNNSYDIKDLSGFLDKNGQCNWLNDFYYGRMSWAGDIWTNQEFFNQLNLLSNRKY